jgi:hypothetical protein
MNNRNLFLAHLAQTTDFPLAIEVVKADGVLKDVILRQTEQVN